MRSLARAVHAWYFIRARPPASSSTEMVTPWSTAPQLQPGRRKPASPRLQTRSPLYSPTLLPSLPPATMQVKLQQPRDHDRPTQSSTPRHGHCGSGHPAGPTDLPPPSFGPGQVGHASHYLGPSAQGRSRHHALVGPPGPHETSRFASLPTRLLACNALRPTAHTLPRPSPLVTTTGRCWRPWP